MACGACGARATNVVYVWTSGDGQFTMQYPTLIQAKAKVMRSGGSYASVTVNPTG